MIGAGATLCHAQVQKLKLDTESAMLEMDQVSLSAACRYLHAGTCLPAAHACKLDSRPGPHTDVAGTSATQ